MFLWQVQTKPSRVIQWPEVFVAIKKNNSNVSVIIATLVYSHQMQNHSDSQHKPRLHFLLLTITVCMKPAEQQNSHNMNLKPLLNSMKLHCIRCSVDKTNPHKGNSVSKSNFTHNHQPFLLPKFDWGNLANLEGR